MAQSPRAFGLGPLETIVNVGWNTGEKIAVVEFSYGCQWHRPLFPMSEFSFTSETPDVTATPIAYLIAGLSIPPAIVNPITDEMMVKVFWWDRHTKSNLNSDGVYSCKALWFFNLTRIKAKRPPSIPAESFTTFRFKISVPAGINVNQDGSIYWVWDDAHNTSLADARANPYTAGSPFPCPGTYCQPSGIVYLPQAFATNGEAAAYASAYNFAQIGQHLVVEAVPDADPHGDFLAWTTRLSTYPKPPDKKRRNFPSDPVDTVDIDWNPNSESKFYSNASGYWPDFVTPSPARLIKYSVDFKTLETAITA